MKAEAIRDTAFAMPLAQPAYPPGPYRFRNREYMILTYRTGKVRFIESIHLEKGPDVKVRFA